MSRTQLSKKNNTNTPHSLHPPNAKATTAPAHTPNTNTAAPPVQQNNAAVSQTATSSDNSMATYPDRSVGKAYKKYLYSPLHEAVMNKFGVGRRGIFRSDELNAFRDRLKKAARLQANDNIANQLDKHESLENKGIFEKKLIQMTANKEAYSLSKQSVDQVMATETEQIIDTLIPEQSAYQQLWDVASRVDSQAALTRDPEQKQTRPVYNAVTKKAEQLLQYIEPIAVNEARAIVKGDKFINGSIGDAMRQQQLEDATKQQVTDDDIAGKAIEKVIEADTLASGLNKIRGIIDLIVPNKGDAASFSCQLKIPFGHTGGYAFVAFETEAEHDDEMKLSAQIGIGLGFDIKVVDVNGQFGMHVEAEADNTQAALNLISYGMYRHTSTTFPSVAEKLWGLGGKSGSSKLEEAEAWATAIEEKHLNNDKHSVQVGNFVQLAVAIDAGITEAEITLYRKGYKHYDKESIEKSTFGNFGDETEWSVLAAKAKTLANYSSRGAKYGASGEVALNLGFGELQLEGEGELDWRDGGPNSIEVSFGIGLPFNYGDDNADWIYIINRIYTPMLGLFTTMNRTINNKVGSQDDADEMSKAQVAGALIDGVSDHHFTTQFDQIGHQLVSATEKIDPDTDEIDHIVKMSSSTALSFSFEYEFGDKEADKESEWEVAAELSNVKSFEVDTGILQFSVEKSKQLAKLGREKKDGKKSNILTILGQE